MYTISNLRSIFRLGIPIVCFGLSISHPSFLKRGPVVPKKLCRHFGCRIHRFSGLFFRFE
ncbi:hypothetical protein LguiB_030954 [Lonicera macranthoides]